MRGARRACSWRPADSWAASSICASPSATIPGRCDARWTGSPRRRMTSPAAARPSLPIVPLRQLELFDRLVDRANGVDAMSAEVVRRGLQLLAGRLELDDGATQVRMRFDGGGRERERAGDAESQQK